MPAFSLEYLRTCTLRPFRVSDQVLSILTQYFARFQAGQHRRLASPDHPQSVASLSRPPALLRAPFWQPAPPRRVPERRFVQLRLSQSGAEQWGRQGPSIHLVWQRRRPLRHHRPHRRANPIENMNVSLRMTPCKKRRRPGLCMQNLPPRLPTGP